MAWGTATQLKDLLYGFKIDEPGAPESAGPTLEDRLEIEAGKIEGEWNTLYNREGLHPIPAPPEEDEDPTLVQVILELLNLETILADIIALRATSNYAIFEGQRRMTKMLAHKRRQAFRENRLRNAILADLSGNPLPTEPLATGADLARDSSGLVLTEYTKPSLTTGERVLLRESCWVRAIAAVSRRYPQDLDTATDLGLRTYKGLVIGMGAPQIERIRLTPKYSPEIDGVILSNIDAGWKAYETFARGGMARNF